MAIELKPHDQREQCTDEECETSPDAPFNQHPIRPLGNRANTDESCQHGDDIERQKQYYKGGKRP